MNQLGFNVELKGWKEYFQCVCIPTESSAYWWWKYDILEYIANKNVFGMTNTLLTRPEGNLKKL
jgi:hypothetical protein